MANSHDGWLVEKFLSLQRQILECCDDQNELIETTARQDPEFRSLCLDFDRITTKLDQESRDSNDGMIDPVSDTFIKQWRFYEKHLRTPITNIAFLDLIDAIDARNDNTHSVSEREKNWNFADDQARDDVASMRHALQYFKEMEDEEDISEGVSAIEKIVGSNDIDIQGFLRRLELVPNLYIPHKVSRSAPGEVFALYDLWADARRAFLFGAPLAALALVRAILEKMLRKFYKAKGESLAELIKSYSRDLGQSEQDDLHRIRIVANAILHTEGKLRGLSEFQLAREKKITARAASDPERETIQLLEAARNLIEHCMDS